MDPGDLTFRSTAPGNITPFADEPSDGPRGIIVRTGGNVYSPPFPRAGSAAVFAVQILCVGGGGSLAVTIQHKNSSDTSWGTAGSFAALSGVGSGSKHIADLKEMIRWCFTLTGGVGNNVMMRVQPYAPAWAPP